LGGPQCGVCRWPQPTSPESANPIRALDSLEHQVARLKHLGILDAGISTSLLTAIADEVQRLRTLESANTASVATSIATPVTNPDLIVPAVVLEEPASAIPPSAMTTVGTVDQVRQRAAQFELRQRQTIPPERIPPTPPATARRSWTDLLAAFMEERNMRWSELVGGLLIVCCSIALVISFWSQIASQPWLKFILFNGVTLGLFALGFYSERQWRLKITSQGTLLIASLLVPLNFLAFAAMANPIASSGPLMIGSEVLSAALFGVALYFAGKILLTRHALWFLVGVLIPALSQLLIRRFIEPNCSYLVLVGLAAVPVSAYLIVNGWAVHKTRSTEPLDDSHITSLVKLLGVTSFAIGLALGLWALKSGDPLEAFRRVVVLPCLLGLPAMANGLLVSGKRVQPGAAIHRVAAASVGIVGALVSISGLVLAWPQPLAMLLAALVLAAVFAAIAWRLVVPVAHIPLAGCICLVYLLAIYLASGQLLPNGMSAREVALQLISGQTGWVLSPIVAVYVVAAYRSHRRRSPAAIMLAAIAAVAAAMSIALVTWFGWGLRGDPVHAGWVYLLYATTGFAASMRLRSRTAPWLSALLLFMAAIQLTACQFAHSVALAAPVITAILVYVTLSLTLAVTTKRLALAHPQSGVVPVLQQAALGASLLSAIWLLFKVDELPVGVQLGRWIWLSAIWLSLALMTSRPIVGTLMQAGLAFSTVLGAMSQIVDRPWFREVQRPWLDPWTLQTLAISLAAWCIAWSIWRIVLQRLSAMGAPASSTANPPCYQACNQLLASRWLSLDRAIAVGLLVLSIAMCSYVALPGVAFELSPREAAATLEQFQLAEIPRQRAADLGTWLLLATLAIVFVVTAKASRSPSWLLGLYVLAAMVAPLLASAWEPQVATASALRWLSAAYFLIGSATVWMLPMRTQRWAEPRSRFADWARAIVFVLGLSPLVAIVVSVGTPAFVNSPQTTAMWDHFSILFFLGGLGLIMASVTALASTHSHLLISPTHARWSRMVSLLMAIICTAPMLAVLIFYFGMYLKAHPIRGPDSDSIFANLGPALSYTLPLVVVALTFIGYAVRDRSPGFALAAGLLIAASATTAYLLTQSRTGLRFDAPTWIRLAQLNAATTAGYALLWCFAGRLRLLDHKRKAVSATSLPWSVQVALAPALTALVVAWSWSQLVAWPQGWQGAPVMLPEFADRWAIASLLLVCTSLHVIAPNVRRFTQPLALSALLTVLALFAAAWASSRDVGNWLAYHTLYVGHHLVALVLLAIIWRARRVPSTRPDSEVPGRALAPPFAELSLILQGAAIFVLAVRELSHDRWWTVLGLASLGAILTPALAWSFQRRRYLYLSATLVIFAGLVAWVEWTGQFRPSDGLYVCATLLGVFAVPWLLIETRGIRHREHGPRWQAPPMHRLAVRCGLALAALAVGLGLIDDAIARPFVAVSWPLNWLALAALGIAAMATLWDSQAKDSVPCLYIWGITASGMLLDSFDLQPDRLLWFGTIVTACYALATSYLWSRRAGLRLLADRFGMPRSTPADLAGLHWLVPCNTLLILAVVGLTLVIELTNREWEMRLAVAQASLAQVVSFALVARGDRRGKLQRAALLTGAMGAVSFGLAWLEVDRTLTWVNCLVVVATATTSVAAIYGFGLTKLLPESNDWLPPAQRLTAQLTGVSAVALLGVLALEIRQFSQQGTVEMAWPAIVLVGLALFAVATAAIAAALVPGRDPLGLSERGRTAYVYAAEIVLALLFVHIRLTMPWLFTGVFQRYWPLIVLGIAFVGVGVAELFRRREQPVLAEPLQNTGALLPVLPVLGYWAMSSSVDYSLLLVCVGLLYGGLSILRRSFGFGLLAALVANGGLWYFLDQQQGLSFFAHPQVWLIPPAVCVLSAAYWNRRQLTETQMGTVRYLGTMTIYVSSTGDIFLNGVAEAPWLPLILAALSIFGILAGMLLRVRAFLFLGLAFLSLALFTIVWYAAVDLQQTWIWYACGIAAGVLLLVLSALFEKLRQETLDVVERLKQWEP
jgi:hypothetical protein